MDNCVSPVWESAFFFPFFYVKYKSKAASTDLAAGNCLMQLFPLFLSLTAVFKC